MEIEKFLLSSIIPIITTLVIILPLLNNKKIRPKGEIIVENAKKEGRVVEATLIKAKQSQGVYETENKQKKSYTDPNWFVIYSYEVNGKKYHYQTMCSPKPPEKVLLYYPKSKPSKAIPENNRKYGFKYIIIMLIPVILWAIIYYII